MQLINGITLLLIYQLAGEVSVRLLGLPVPGPVMGMVMLFITLMIRGQMAKAVEPACIALLGHLSLLFVPAGVGLIVHFNRLGNEWLPISVTLLLSTIITMAVTALVMQWVTRLTARREPNHD
ncbi:MULTISPECIES: CidA/LrgA family protein [Marinobacter]|jgi:holin-like protein|uniref:CidA/LrgA family protein n=1 Tax=Marinobacter TaxID=2742 RepID=UPI0002776BB1|nr:MULTISPECIES: CidA/LrgA family protein [Marinobacter]AFP29275.1 LrgA [Marinobacter sp. BSs20148]MBQ0761780.1 CidA/LrgA family protein [Marinobacter psychrophilus]MBQ0846438.1 CidA/LrgA family protein [Marinobacter psychrophilus]